MFSASKTLLAFQRSHIVSHLSKYLYSYKVYELYFFEFLDSKTLVFLENLVQVTIFALFKDHLLVCYYMPSFCAGRSPVENQP